MVRSLILVAALLSPVVAQAQYAAPERQIPIYDDGYPADPSGYDDSNSSADARRHDDQMSPKPSAEGDEDYRSAKWHTPGPYARQDQVDEGRPDDEAHRADRAYTADLNRRPWPGRNVAPTDDRNAGSSATYSAELADHARAIQDYRAAQARYADRLAHWRARSDACEHGDTYACDGPE